MSGVNDRRFGVGYLMTWLNGSRKYVAFAAFAAEAYINRFLHNRLSGQDKETALRLRPVIEKFVFAPRLALEEPLFRRDELLHRDLKELFALRNGLVHAEPREVAVGQLVGDKAFEQCNPLVAHRFLLIAAQAGRRILPALDPPANTLLVEQIIETVGPMKALAKHAATMPLPTAEAIRAELEEAHRTHP
jgi:hypothetical protein